MFCAKFCLSCGKNVTEFNLKYAYVNIYEEKGEHGKNVSKRIHTGQSSVNVCMHKARVPS